MARDGGRLGLSSLVTAALQLLLQVIVVRRTTPTEFGLLAAMMVWTNVLEMVVTSRSGELALQTVGRDYVRGDTSHASAAALSLERHDLLLYSGVALLAAVVAWPLCARFGGSPWWAAGLLLALPANAGYGVSKSVIIASGRIREQALFESAQSTATFVFGAIGVLVAGIGGYVAGLVAATVVKTVMARRMTAPLVPRTLADPAAHAEHARLRVAGWWRRGRHSLARNVLNYTAGQADLVLLGAFRGPEAVAAYKVAKSLANIPIRASAPIWSALRPRLMSAWHAGERRRALDLVRLPAGGLLAMIIVALVPVAVFATDGFVAIYGADYAASAIPFVHLLWGTLLFQAVTGWFPFWVVIAEQRREGTLVYAGYLGLLVVGAALAGGRSAEAMAIAVASASAATSVACWALFLARIRGLRPSRRVGPAEATA